MTKQYLGYFENSELVGVVTLGWGTQPKQTIQKIFYKHDIDTNDYFEIGKMCFRPDKNNGNFGSQALKLLVQYCKQNTNIKFLYTLADGIMGKLGYVYQASNFTYLGSFKTDVYIDKTTKEKIHPRSAKQLCMENAEWSGKTKVFWLTADFCEYKGIDRIKGLMFRYMFPMSKKYKKWIDSYPEYQNNTYPKENDLLFERRVENGKYERISQPTFNMDVFEHNYQKYNTNQTSKIKEFFNID